MKRIILVSLIVTFFFSVGVLRADQVCGNFTTVTPAVLDFGTVVTGGSKTLTITNNSARTVNEQHYFFQSSSGKLILSDDEKILFSKTSFGLGVTLPSNLPLGGFNDQVVILANNEVFKDGKLLLSEKVEQCRVPVTANVVRPIEVSVPSIDFGTVVQGSNQNKTFNVKANVAESLQFSFIRFSFIRLNPTSATLASGASQSVDVTLPSGETTASGGFLVPVGSLSGTILISITSAKLSSLPLASITVTANVTAPPPPPPPGTPDLAFSGAIFPTVSGQGNNKTVTVNLTVQNIGTADSPQQCSGEVLLDDVAQTSFTIPPIAQGQSSGLLKVSFETNQHGTHTLTVNLDSLSQVSENNENNNVATGQVSL